MRQAREIIHLKFSACVPTREIARRLGIAASTVRETLRRLESTGLNWPLPDDMTDGKLETALYTNRGTKQGHRRHAEPDWPMVHRELKRKHVTLLIVWDEYIAENPGGYSYSRFCELYRAFESRLPVTMRQTHAAGERLFVDYAGDGVPVVIDRLTGEIRKGQIFVAVLGASSFTYARATWTQTLVDWIDAHVQAFGAIGGAPHLLVPDNTKAAIGELLKLLNEERPIRRLGVTRRQLLEEVDRPALKPLPVEPYVFCEWRACRIGIDYHVEADAHYYSVPHRFARADVDVRLTARTVEVFLKGDRIAAHMRMRGNRKHTTVAEHMPSSHRRYKDWTIDRIRADARLIGPATAALCELILEQRPHPEQGFRACLGIVRLAGPYGVERVEAAAERAIEIGARTYGSVRSILDNKLDRRPTQKRATDGTPILHANIRGPRYYN